MFKVLLTDDDIMILEGLMRLIPWQVLGLTVVGTAKEGYSALELIEREKPDILVADIAMPSLSGLELARRARKILPDLMIIFLTGHEDFSYAKQAIEIHAEDYILKPVNYTVLSEKLKACCNVLAQRYEKRIKDHKLNHSVKHVKNDILLRWLQGNSSFDIIPEIIKDRFPNYTDNVYRVVLLEWDDAACFFYKDDLKDGTGKNSKLFCMQMEMLGDQSVWYGQKSHSIQSDGVVCILDSRMLEKLFSLLQEFHCGKDPGFAIAIGPETPFHKLPDSYTMAQGTMVLKLFNTPGQALFFDETRLQSNHLHKKNLDNMLESVLMAIAGSKPEMAKTALKSLAAFLKELGNDRSLKSIAVYVLVKLDEFVHTLGDGLVELLSWNIDLYEEMAGIEHENELVEWAGKVFSSVSNSLNNRRRGRKNSLIEKAEKYIEGHLEEEFALKDVAESLMLSPNYLGFLFKEECGETFSDYVSRKRMERARDLLDDSNLKIYEIADRLGYKSMTYFHSRFKEFFGISPGDYRKKRV